MQTDCTISAESLTANSRMSMAPPSPSTAPAAASATCATLALGGSKRQRKVQYRGGTGMPRKIGLRRGGGGGVTAGTCTVSHTESSTSCLKDFFAGRLPGPIPSHIQRCPGCGSNHWTGRNCDDCGEPAGPMNLTQPKLTKGSLDAPEAIA